MTEAFDAQPPVSQPPASPALVYPAPATPATPAYPALVYPAPATPAYPPPATLASPPDGAQPGGEPAGFAAGGILPESWPTAGVSDPGPQALGLVSLPAPVPIPPRRGLPILPIAAAGLVMALITVVGLLWLNGWWSGAVTSRDNSVPVVAGPVATLLSDSPSQVAGAGGPELKADPARTAGTAADATPTSTSTSPKTGTDVVQSLDALLDRSTAARGNVAATVSALQTCRVSATQAAVTFRLARDNRQGLASEATALSSSAVGGAPNVGNAVRAFIALQESSARADGAFADWADEIATAGCQGKAGHTTNWNLANRYSADASAAKAKFVKLWNPIAAEHELRSRTAGGI